MGEKTHTSLEHSSHLYRPTAKTYQIVVSMSVHNLLSPFGEHILLYDGF